VSSQFVGTSFRRTALNLISVLVFAGSIPLLLLHLESIHFQTQESYRQIIETLESQSLSKRMSDVADLVSGRESNARSVAEDVPRELPILDAFDAVPGKTTAAFEERKGIHVSYGAVAALFLPRDSRIATRLPDHYRERVLKSDWHKYVLRCHPGWLGGHNVATDVVAFSYAAMEFSDGDVFLCYPATLFEHDYDFRQRPWYRVGRQGRQTSELYADWASQAPIISLVKVRDGESELDPTVTRVVSDIVVRSPTSNLGVLALNAIVSALIAFIALRFYLFQRGAMELMLCFGTATLAGTYTVLAIAEINLGDRQQDLVRNITMFAPSSTFFLLASCALRGRYVADGRWLLILRDGALLYALEASLAALDLAEGYAFFNPALACIALGWFGVRLWHHRTDFSEPYLRENVNPYPKTTIVLAAAAYVVWAVGQFVFMALESPELMRTSGELLPWTMLVLGEQGGFIVLLYAKGAAYFLTGLMLFARQSASEHRSYERLVQGGHITVDKKGIVRNHQNIPGSDLTIGSSIYDYVDRDFASPMLAELIDKCHEKGLKIRLPRLFGSVPVRLAAIENEDHTVQLDVFVDDEQQLMRFVERVILAELRKFCCRAPDEANDAARLDEMNDLLRVLDAGSFGGSSDGLSERELCDQLRARAAIAGWRCSEFSEASPNVQTGIPAQPWLFALDGLINAFRGSGIDPSRVRVSLASPSRFVSVSVTVPENAQVRQMCEEFEASEKLSYVPDNTGLGLIASSRMLGEFGGQLRIEVLGAERCVSVEVGATRPVAEEIQ